MNLSINAKLHVVSLILLFGVVLLGYFSWQHINVLDDMSDQRIDIIDFQSRLTELQQEERAFVATRDFSYTEKFFNDYDDLIASTENIKLYLNEINVDDTNIGNFISIVENYKQSFDELSQIMLKIGRNQKEGVRGELRKHIYGMEAILKEIDNSNNVQFALHRRMLMIQRPEKNLMLRKQDKYIKKFAHFANVMRDDIQDKVKDPDVKGRLLTELDLYEQSFNKLQKAALTIGLTFKGGLQSQMGTMITEAHTLARIMADEFVAIIDEKSASSRRTIIILVGIFVFVIFISIILLSRSIVRSLKAMTDVMRKLANGDMDVQIPNIEQTDEIGDMAKSLVVFKENAIERHEAKQALLTAHDELEVIVEKRTHELSLAKSEAENANHAKSEFLSSMSHELRTPMNAVLGFTQLMQRSRKEPPQEKQTAYLKQIDKAGKHLLVLINDVLDLARIESGNMVISIENVDIRSIISETFDMVHPLALSRGQVLSEDLNDFTDQNVNVLADYTRLKQVIVNFLSNAIKYGRENGHVTLKVSKGLNEEMLRISVIDDGGGIPKNRHKELFESFKRIDQEDTDIEGTGVGLAITQKLIHLMNGDIGVNSELGQGATFWVELPCFKDSNESIAGISNIVSTGGENEAHAAKGVSLLYVEDNPANMTLMEEVLGEIDNATMLPAQTPELGIELAKSHLPDIIVLDINLPGMSGFQVLEALQKEETTRHIPVIALSANAMPKDLEKGVKAGFKHYLTKPLNIDEFIDAVDAILSKETTNATLE